MTISSWSAIVLLAVSTICLVYAFLLRTRLALLRAKLKTAYRKQKVTEDFHKLFQQNFSSSNELKDWMDKTAHRAASLLQAQSIAIFLEENGFLQAAGVDGPFPLLSSEHRHASYVLAKPKYVQDALKREKYRIGEGFLGEIAEKREEVLIQSSASDPRIAELGELDIPIRTFMAVPLINDGKMKGIICAVNQQQDRGFTEEDLDNFRTIAVHVVQAQNVIESYSNLSEQQRISQELIFARNLQLSMIPKKAPVWGNFVIQAFTRASKEVSGDFYDFVQIDENRLLVVIGDACGKGIPACMIMAMTRAFLRSGIDRFTSLKDMLRELNESLYRDTADERYITLGCCLLDKKESTMEYARAGHTPLLMFLHQHIRPINPEGAGLGLLPSDLSDFDTLCTSISPDTTMLMFTDGINEATDDQDRYYGIGRVSEIYSRSCLAGHSPEEVIQDILRDVEEYSAGDGTKEQEDDQTIVVIRHV